MNILTLIILGALQGLLEWLPVSSEGVLVAIITLLGENPSIAIDYALFLHAGTMLAALVYYRKEFKEMILEGTLLRFTIIVTVITTIIGGALYFTLRNISSLIGAWIITLIGGALIITGLLQLKKKKGLKTKPDNKDALITGAAQGFSIIPGISRSGTTISTLLFKGFKGSTALKLSFILSVPAILIAQAGLGLMSSPAVTWQGFWGLMTSFVVGLASIKALTRVARRVNFGKFCIIMGIVMITTILIH
ncbi:UDP-diphosphatase [archaeon]|nr:UDP-diphosphatase [archaeon]